VRLIRSGDTGEGVRDVQRRLLALDHRIEQRELDGTFGPTTEVAVRAFQGSRGLPQDGIVGPDTWGRLVEASYRLGDRTLYLRSPNSRGDDVLELQHRLNEMGFDVGKEDGIFGPRTHAAVLDFQRNTGAEADGIVGLGTVRALAGLRPAVPGPSRAVVREEAGLLDAGAGLRDAAIAVDGSGEGDDGVAGIDAEGSADLATALARALREAGARPIEVVAAGRTLTDRAHAANEARAGAYLALRIVPPPLPGVRAPGPAFWGTPATRSPAGSRLADLVVDELGAVGVALDAPRASGVAILRETRMPAVIIEVPEDAASATVVADAIARALDRFFGSNA
jgi:N-acetylmuramoyl-L-alanine amidase